MDNIEYRNITVFPSPDESYYIVYDSLDKLWYVEFEDEDIEYSLVLESPKENVIFIEDEEVLSLGITEEYFKSLKNKIKENTV